jgi:lysophospholipase L1-like esterase
MKSKAKLLIITFCSLLISWTSSNETLNIYSIGDSTMCNIDTTKNNPGRGWMQVMGMYFDSKVKISNMAVSGRSSKSFRSEGKWDKVISKVSEGDYVFIQFGHNDEKTDSLRHTKPETSFKQNLIDYVNEVRAKKAIPILFTSIPRRVYDSNGELKDTHGAYVTVVRVVASELNVHLVDLNKRTIEYINQLGPEESKSLFIHIGPGVSPRFPNGKKDDTHLSKKGAEEVARLATYGLKELKLPISGYIQH